MILSEEIVNKNSIQAYNKLVEYAKTTDYTYDKSVYKGTKTKIIITCNTHGDFEQTPNNHTKGHGCPKCKFDKLAKINNSSTEEFIVKAKFVHKELYDYSKVSYIKNSTKITITCYKHGDFEQSPADHLSGKGCKECGLAKQVNSQTFNQIEFEKKANKVHNSKYNYSKALYTKMQNKVIIICPEHGEFEQKATNHITQKQGCPTCGNIQKLKKYQEYPTILYMLFFTNLNLYKLGITMEKRGLKTRYNSEKEPYIVCKQIVFNDGESAYVLEQMLLNKYKLFSYTGPNVLKAGNTELFTKDILADHLNI